MQKSHWFLKKNKFFSQKRTLKPGTQDGFKKTTSFAFGSLKIKYTDIDMILINIPDADNTKESSSP